MRTFNGLVADLLRSTPVGVSVLVAVVNTAAIDSRSRVVKPVSNGPAFNAVVESPALLNMLQESADASRRPHRPRNMCKLLF